MRNFNQSRLSSFLGEGEGHMKCNGTDSNIVDTFSSTVVLFWSTHRKNITWSVRGFEHNVIVLFVLLNDSLRSTHTLHAAYAGVEHRAILVCAALEVYQTITEAVWQRRDEIVIDNSSHTNCQLLVNNSAANSTFIFNEPVNSANILKSAQNKTTWPSDALWCCCDVTCAVIG